MADQWQAKVKTINGRAVAVVEVRISRTIFVDADVWERFAPDFVRGGRPGRDAEPLGLSEVGDLYESIQQIPDHARKYVTVAWSDADERKIGLRRFADIVDFLEDRLFWTVEGSADTGFTCIVNIGGSEVRLDMSTEAKIDAIAAQVAQMQAQAQTDLADQLLTQEEKDAFDGVCGVIGEADNYCRGKIRQREREQQEQDRRRREQEEEERRRREVDKSSSAEVRTGDYPQGWEGRFKDHA